MPITAATVFCAVVFVYCLSPDWMVALLQLIVTLPLLWLADRAAVLPFGESAGVFAATLVGGRVIQLVGHAIEGRRPALADNILQVFNAPLFLTAEVLNIFGLRRDLQASVAQL